MASDAVHVPPPTDLGLMLLGIAAVSTSGPLMTATAAPALAIAFWRNAMATGLLVPWSLLRARAELRGLAARQWRVTGLAGVLLAVHFATWVPSLRYTSVASATALVATQPVWAAVIARQQGYAVPRRAWLGIGVAVLGAGLLTGADVTLSARALTGDLLAAVAGAAAAAYVTAGSTARQRMSTTAYTTLCYGTTAVLLLCVCAVGGLQLAGYSANAWAKLVALTAGAQLLGHSVFNRVLRTTSPTVVSLAILFEVPGAALIAALWLHQHPHGSVLAGVAVLLAGLALVVTAPRRGPAAVPVE